MSIVSIELRKLDMYEVSMCLLFESEINKSEFVLTFTTLSVDLSEYIRIMTESAPTLKSFSSDYERLSDSNVLVVLQNCPELQCISVQEARLLTSDVYQEMSEHGANLEHIHFKNCRHMTGLESFLMNVRTGECTL